MKNMLALTGLAMLLISKSVSAQDYTSRVNNILKSTPLIDGHNDWPERLRGQYGEKWWEVDLADLRTNTTHYHTDINRLRKGMVGGQFWSVWVPTELHGADAVMATLEQIDMVHGLVKRYPNTFELATTAEEVHRIHKSGKIASLIGVEGGHQINNSLPVLRRYYALGARYMTLTHTQNIDWADSSNVNPKHGGLTTFGKAVIGEMNRLGMLVDLSHVSADTMRSAIAISKAPVIFSHSSARALSDHPRNVPDDVLRLVKANDGVVMINFFPVYVSGKRFKWQAELSAEKALQEALFLGQPDKVKTKVDAWILAHPMPRTTLSDVADQIEYVAKIAGHDHVGLGGDYDGVKDIPEGMDGVDNYPALLKELMRRGWNDADIAAVGDFCFDIRYE